MTNRKNRKVHFLVDGKRTVSKSFKQIGQWILALILAALVMNLVLAFYNRAAGWIDRTAGSTTAIYNPNSSMVHGTEGRGYHRIDARGYVNNTSNLADNYVIAIGASYTQGKEVNDGERYTDLLNSWLGYSEEAFVYNVSQDAYYFPEIVKGFSALLQEFPQTNKIIIEIGRTNYTNEELVEALNQRPYDEMQTGENILSTLSWKKKINIYLKEYSPLLFNANNKVKAIKELKSNKENLEKSELDLDLYKENLDAVFKFLTEVYDKEIIILYHPSVTIEKDGTLIIETKDTDDLFRDACKKNDITLVDMSDKFLLTYNDTYELPYGFSNTSLGQGHFSAAGHRMIAEELIKCLESEE